MLFRARGSRRRRECACVGCDVGNRFCRYISATIFRPKTCWMRQYAAGGSALRSDYEIEYCRANSLASTGSIANAGLSWQCRDMILPIVEPPENRPGDNMSRCLPRVLSRRMRLLASACGLFFAPRHLITIPVHYRLYYLPNSVSGCGRSLSDVAACIATRDGDPTSTLQTTPDYTAISFGEVFRDAHQAPTYSSHELGPLRRPLFRQPRPSAWIAETAASGWHGHDLHSHNVLSGGVEAVRRADSTRRARRQRELQGASAADLIRRAIAPGKLDPLTASVFPNSENKYGSTTAVDFLDTAKHLLLLRTGGGAAPLCESNAAGGASPREGTTTLRPCSNS